MMKVLIDINAAGKTLYLRNLLVKLDNVITNMQPDLYGKDRKYNLGRLEVLAEYLIADDVVEQNGHINIINNYVPCSDEFKTEALKLCKEGDYLVLDEPDALLDETDGNMLYNFMKNLIPTYKECYVATHSQCLIGEAFCTCYKIGENGELVQIEEEEAHEYVD